MRILPHLLLLEKESHIWEWALKSPSSIALRPVPCNRFSISSLWQEIPFGQYTDIRSSEVLSLNFIVTPIASTLAVVGMVIGVACMDFFVSTATHPPC